MDEDALRRVVYNIKNNQGLEFTEVYNDQLKVFLGDVIREAGQKTTDYDKAKVIYNWIIENIEYDYATYNTESSEFGHMPEKDSILHVMSTKKAMCGGYANLFNYVAKLCGLDGTKVDGLSEDGNGHIWNIVLDKVTNEYIFIDTTYGVNDYENNFTYLPNHEFSKNHRVWNGEKYIEITETYLTNEKNN